MKEGETRTQIIEHGVFKRTYTRVGKKKRVKTERLKKNPKKVSLGKIGDLEFYVFPYEYPERVFIGKYPDFKTSIDIYQLPMFFGMHNKMSWFLNEKWTTEPKNKRKHKTWSKTLRRRIKTAYNLGLEELRSKEKP